MSEVEFADKLGISRSTLRRVLQGVTPATSDMLQKVAVMANKPIGWLFDDGSDTGTAVNRTNATGNVVAEPAARYESNATPVANASGSISLMGLLSFTLEQLADEAERLEECAEIGKKLRELSKRLVLKP